MRGLALVLVLAGGPAFAAGQAVTLAYRVAPAPVEYWSRTTESVLRDDQPTAAAKAAETWHSYDVFERVGVQVTAAADGQLAVSAQALGRQMKVDGRWVDRQLPSTSVAYRMDARGTRAASEDPAGGLTPVFPAEAVAPGDAWRVPVAATAKFPHAFEVAHRFERVETFQGERCAVITSQAQVKIVEKDLAFNLMLAGALRLSLDTGQMLKSSSIAVFNTKAARAFKGGHRTLRRQVVRVVERRVTR